jgi:hypothetical protein
VWDQRLYLAAQMANDELLKSQLEELRREHRKLDADIETLHTDHTADQLTLRRLKKRKLHLKDEIARIEDRLYPDIIA